MFRVKTSWLSLCLGLAANNDIYIYCDIRMPMRTVLVCVSCQDSVRHHDITINGSCYTFGLASFHSARDFLDHFDSHPIVAGESGV